MGEVKELSFLKRIQTARMDLSEMNLKKSGYNPYSKYNYWELGDFLPAIIKICDKYNLFTEFQIDLSNDTASLTILDCESDDKKKEWITKISKMQLKGCNEMQNIQGTHTSAKKILYLEAFEIAESDLGEITKQEEALNDEGNELISLAQMQTITRLIKETNTPVEKIYTAYDIEKFEEMTNKQYYNAVHRLYATRDKLEAQKKANELAQSLNMDKSHTQENNQIAFGGNK